MSDLSAILAGTIWQDWRAEPIPGDASARRYHRLFDGKGNSVILMQSGDVPTAPFVTMARHLESLGLCAPRILRDASPNLVLSDLGPQDLARALDDGAPALPLYTAAVEVLTRLHDSAPPELGRMTPRVGGDMVRITAEHYTTADADRLAAVMEDHLHRLTTPPDRLSLRDYHVENLIWRPDRTGTDRIGLLDFQDAFVAPAGYDLASLLRDVRRAVPDEVATRMKADFSARIGVDPVKFSAQLACLGAQRNLRILGVFARLIRVQGKTRYTALMPRVWQNLSADLDHPALTGLRRMVQDQIAPPDAVGFGA